MSAAKKFYHQGTIGGIPISLDNYNSEYLRYLLESGKFIGLAIEARAELEKTLLLLNAILLELELRDEL